MKRTHYPTDCLIIVVSNRNYQQAKLDALLAGVENMKILYLEFETLEIYRTDMLINGKLKSTLDDEDYQEELNAKIYGKDNLRRF